MSSICPIAKLLDSDIEELIQASLLRSYQDASVSAYCEILIAYGKCDTAKLKKLSEDASLPVFIRNLAELRHELRIKKLSDLMVWKARLKDIPLPWQAEALFALSMLAADLNQHQDFHDLSQEAAASLRKIGAKKKAVKALMNCVVAKSRIEPELSWITEYYLIFKLARQAKAYDSAGICLHNIAKEYQTLGAYSSALLYANRSLKYLDRHRGGLNYFLALALRSYIFVSLGRLPEAKLDYELARYAKFPEITEALKILQVAFEPGHAAPIQLEYLTPAWRERVENNRVSMVRVGSLEDKAVRYLSNGSLTKHELISKLYGSNIDIFSAENRLKNLLNRIRKRHKGLIVYDEGKYLLGEPMHEKNQVV